MSGVFQNIDPPPPHRLASVYPSPPPPLVRGEDTLARGRGGGRSIVRKTPDTALYSISVSTLCSTPSFPTPSPLPSTGKTCTVWLKILYMPSVLKSKLVFVPKLVCWSTHSSALLSFVLLTAQHFFHSYCWQHSIVSIQLSAQFSPVLFLRTAKGKRGKGKKGVEHLVLKGLCHKMNIFFVKVLKIKSVLSVYSPIV